MPLGWAWAAFWCQTIVQRMISTSKGNEDAKRLIDGREPPPSTSMHTVYIDNFVNMGTDESSVQECAHAGNAVLGSSGMELHEVQSVASGGAMLGWEFDSAVFRPSRKRVWKARLAIRELLRVGRASGRLVERLVGHMCFISLARREIFAVLGTVFAFIKQCYFKSVVIWSSVRRELIMWDALVPLVYQDLSLPWSPEIHCVDASEWGLEHCSATATVEEVKSAGRIAEKKRFDSELHSKAKAANQMQELEGELLSPTIESS